MTHKFTHKFVVPKVPPLVLTLRRQKQEAEDQDEWEWQDLQQQAPRSEWWKHVPKEHWDAVKEETPPKDDTDSEPPKVGGAPRSRAGRVQIRPKQVRRSRIRNVKPTALRVQNIVVARGMLGRVSRSGKPQSPNIVHVKIMTITLPIGAKHTWLQATV